MSNEREEALRLQKLAASGGSHSTMQNIVLTLDKLPPLDRDDHPDPQGWRWTNLEVDFIKKYARSYGTPLLAEIQRLKRELELAEHASVSQSQLYAEYQEEWQRERDELRAKLEAALRDAQKEVLSSLVQALGNPEPEHIGFKRIPMLRTYSVHDPIPVDGSYRDLPVYEWKLQAVDCQDLLTALFTAIDATRADKPDPLEGKLGMWSIERLK